MENQTSERFHDYGVCELHKVELDNNCLRYYRIEIVPGLFSPIVSRFWGRIGRAPRCKEDFFESLEDGIRAANRLYRRKRSRGYREIGMWGLSQQFMEIHINQRSA